MPHSEEQATYRRAWWKESVIYQIYPASFADSNRDGWGDLPGIISKLDYLKDLGVDMIWVCPTFKSPQCDIGYDVSDYKDVEPRYGTLSDLEELISELKKREMKLMPDLVLNQTSDQHPWFLESRSSKENPKRHWYIWRQPNIGPDGKRFEPNNWYQILGEGDSAWTYNEATGDFLSLVTHSQPGLNWENAEVREAVFDICRFWLGKGVSRFRLDAMYSYDGWNSIFCGNHDQPRCVSRYTDDCDDQREVGAKLMCLMQNSLAGTLFVYQGEEIGMKDVPRTWSIDKYEDVESTLYHQNSKMHHMCAGNPQKIEYCEKVIHGRARDHARTPFQWDDSPNAGFCGPTVTPWMRANNDWKTVNAKAQISTKSSVFSFWQRALALRREYGEVFIYGNFECLDNEHPSVFAYLRRFSLGKQWIVILNFCSEVVEYKLPSSVIVEERTISNYMEGTILAEISNRSLHLRPWEGLIGQCLDGETGPALDEIKICNYWIREELELILEAV